MIARPGADRALVNRTASRFGLPASIPRTRNGPAAPGRQDQGERRHRRRSVTAYPRSLALA